MMKEILKCLFKAPGSSSSAAEAEVSSYRLRDVTDNDYREVYRNYENGDSTSAVILDLIRRIKKLEGR